MNSKNMLNEDNLDQVNGGTCLDFDPRMIKMSGASAGQTGRQTKTGLKEQPGGLMRSEAVEISKMKTRNV